MALPDYQSGSSVNLMAALLAAMGVAPRLYRPLRSPELDRLSAARNIVLLVVDGLGYDYLQAVGVDSILHQYLRSRITSVFPPTTATAITSFLTGTAPLQHGLTGWFTYFRELGSVIAVLPFKSRAGGVSLANSSVRASDLFDHKPVFDVIDRPSYCVVPAWIAHSEFNVAHSGSATIRAYDSLPQLFHTIEAIVRQRNRRRYIYAYWPELDNLAHTHGIASKPVKARFVEFNTVFEKFLKAIEGSETSVVVTSDHGFIDTDPSRCIDIAAHPVLASCLVLPLCGEPRSAYCYVHPDKCEQFKTYLENELADRIKLIESQELVGQGYFGIGNPHPRFAERIGHYALLMQDNYIIRDWVLGEERHAHIGVHGGLSPQELYVPLVVVET